MNLNNWIQGVEVQRNRIAVMGILNVTPDSFSDGGKLSSSEAVKHAAQEMIQSGVDMIDVGGESTRPGSDPVSLQEELKRVIPAIDLIRSFSDIPISIDTYKPEVMKAAIEAGANMINDVNALQANGARQVAAELGVPVCLMHKKGVPKTMQDQPYYEDVVQEVADFFEEQISLCLQAGVMTNQIMLDPGFGFGKRLEDNIALFKNMDSVKKLDIPLLIGVSRKRMIGQILNLEQVDHRMVGSVTAALLAAQSGAKMVRVHDVKETVQALNIASALS